MSGSINDALHVAWAYTVPSEPVIKALVLIEDNVTADVNFRHRFRFLLPGHTACRPAAQE